MRAAPSLLECQRQFLAALYAPDEPGPVEAIVGHGLEPAARLRIYRHSCEAIQTGALRTTYPAVRALVGEAFFDQCALGYRREHVSRSGNLQAFGAHFADYLQGASGTQALPYLPDVARLEWLRQQAVLAVDADALPVAAGERALAAEECTLALHPCVQRLASAHAVLTIFLFAMAPTDAGLRLPNGGENVLLWRAGGTVAMAALDAASFACIEALALGRSLAAARAAAYALDPRCDLGACVNSLLQRGLFVAPASIPIAREFAPCR